MLISIEMVTKIVLATYIAVGRGAPSSHWRILESYRILSSKPVLCYLVLSFIRELFLGEVVAIIR